jgi:hypothetical protein
VHCGKVGCRAVTVAEAVNLKEPQSMPSGDLWSFRDSNINREVRDKGQGDRATILTTCC